MTPDGRKTYETKCPSTGCLMIVQNCLHVLAGLSVVEEVALVGFIDSDSDLLVS